MKPIATRSIVPLRNLLEQSPQNGYSPVCLEKPTGKWVLSLAALGDEGIDLSMVKPAPLNDPKVDRFTLAKGDILISRASGTLVRVGRVALYNGGLEHCSFPDIMMRFRPITNIVDAKYLEIFLGSSFVRNYIQTHIAGSNGTHKINKKVVEEIPILFLPLQDQIKISNMLTTWDKAINQTDRLIKAILKRNEALSNYLLFGHSHTGSKQRLHWFSIPHNWETAEIGEIAHETYDINIDGKTMPVFSCTKHQGLVDSLQYFNKQIFSQDTSNYKIVRRGQFAYATNHIEEGSIGYQDSVSAGLVSPIYTVFQTDSSKIDDGYFYKLLKTERLRQIFAADTNSSVNRRGSLRWKAFAQIQVPIPPLSEQRRISAIIDEAKREANLLKLEAEALKTQKRGLMQKLLTDELLGKLEKTEVTP